MRRFAVVGHRAMARGKLPINDLAGAAGRFDVLVRATTSALLTSHGLRDDVEVILHLGGGPGPPRRLRLNGSTLRGLHADERSAAGTLGKALLNPQPPRGQWREVTPGLDESGGTLPDTLREWKDTTVFLLDADAPSLEGMLNDDADLTSSDLGFVLSDDQPLGDGDLGGHDVARCSLGSRWLQGHAAVHIVHWLLDRQV